MTRNNDTKTPASSDNSVRVPPGTLNQPYPFPTFAGQRPAQQASSQNATLAASSIAEGTHNPFTSSSADASTAVDPPPPAYNTDVPPAYAAGSHQAADIQLGILQPTLGRPAQTVTTASAGTTPTWDFNLPSSGPTGSTSNARVLSYLSGNPTYPNPPVNNRISTAWTPAPTYPIPAHTAPPREDARGAVTNARDPSPARRAAAAQKPVGRKSGFCCSLIFVVLCLAGGVALMLYFHGVIGDYEGDMGQRNGTSTSTGGGYYGSDYGSDPF